MIILLSLESLELRYTAQWARWFPEQLKKDKVEFATVHGTALTKTIEVGSVLDAYGTNFYKMTQLANLIRMLRDGFITNKDTLLFADLWFPGIEALKYIACLGGAKPKITGILHAGTYDQNDFTFRAGMRPWGHNLEQAWFQMYDLVFVATQYHRDLILKNHNVDPDKIVVTGLPFYPDEIVTNERKQMVKIHNSIVFPHRLDPEKHPEKFDMMRENELIPWLCTRTVDHFTTKDKYYDELAHHTVAVSFADQETFGYAMLEATALGCYPLVPDRLSYQEMYPRKFRYQTHEELIGKILQFENERNDEEVRELALSHRAEYMGSITRMINCIHNRFNI
jgi:hypothetical protein